MDLALVVVAFVFGFAANAIRLPPLVGYLAAGFVLHGFGVEETEGVELIACKMTVDMMELDEAKLISGVVVWTAEDFLRYARECKVCLFT